MLTLFNRNWYYYLYFYSKCYNLVKIQLRYGLVDIFTPVIADGLQWQAVMAYISAVQLLLSGKKSGWLPVTIRFV